MSISKSALAHFKEWGKKGGKARAKRLTPERRSEIARNAVAAREAKKKGKTDAAD
jgi:hypothetical protein